MSIVLVVSDGAVVGTSEGVDSGYQVAELCFLTRKLKPAPSRSHWRTNADRYHMLYNISSKLCTMVLHTFSF